MLSYVQTFWNAFIVFLLFIQVYRKTIVTIDPICSCLIGATLFHAASYASSSFIEEEHQLWYYMTITLLLALFVMWFRKFKSASWFSAKRSTEPSTSDIGFNWQLIKWCQTYYLEVCWIVVLVGQIFLRRLNQTGDKWLSVPDIGDWLVMDGNRMVNSVFTFFGEYEFYVPMVNFKNTLQYFTIILLKKNHFFKFNFCLNFFSLKHFTIHLKLYVKRNNRLRATFKRLYLKFVSFT